MTVIKKIFSGDLFQRGVVLAVLPTVDAGLLGFLSSPTAVNIFKAMFLPNPKAASTAPQPPPQPQQSESEFNNLSQPKPLREIMFPDGKRPESPHGEVAMLLVKGNELEGSEDEDRNRAGTATRSFELLREYFLQ